MTGVDLAVTGLGLVTPAGIGTDANWDRICTGESAARTDPELTGLPVTFSCRVPGFDAKSALGRRAWQYDRFVQFALVAAKEAVADAGLDPTTWDGARVGIVMGCGLGGVSTWETQHRRMLADGPQAVSALLIPMLVPNMVAGHLGIALRATGPNFVTATACASGSTAIGVASDLLRNRTCDIVIAGGSEAGVSPLILTGFAQMTALSKRNDDPAAASRPFDVNRDGFVLGEGSGVLVLERSDDARARGARVRARLLGYGASADAHHMTAPDPQGHGAARAVRAALADAGLGPGDVDHVNAHGTSTPANDHTEARMIAGTLGPRPTVTSTKGVVGHALGAAGAIEAAYTVLSLQHATVPPTANLDQQDPQIELDVVTKAPRAGRLDIAMSNSFGFGGQNAVLVFGAA